MSVPTIDFNFRLLCSLKMHIFNHFYDSDVEKTEDPSLLFRGNSIATKAVDLYMKLIGSKYLKNTLGLFIRDVYDNAQEFEVEIFKV